MTSNSGAFAYFDVSVLRSCGLRNLGDEDAADLIRELNDNLELKVGTALSGNLTNNQMEEFGAIISGGDSNQDDDDNEDAAAAWLRSNVPDHAAVVKEVFGLMLTELRDNARRIAEACRVEYVDSDFSTKQIDVVSKR